MFVIETNYMHDLPFDSSSSPERKSHQQQHHRHHSVDMHDSWNYNSESTVHSRPQHDDDPTTTTTKIGNNRTYTRTIKTSPHLLIKNKSDNNDIVVSPSSTPTRPSKTMKNPKTGSTHTVNRNANTKNDNNFFRILCTTRKQPMQWGSYKIRCRDWARWATHCAPDVQIVVGEPIESFYVAKLDWPKLYKDVFWNATVIIKSIPDMDRLKSRLDIGKMGNVFVDLVDWFYVRNENEIPKGVKLILQTKRQGEEMFPHQEYHVVEHWYNSFPDDMVMTTMKDVTNDDDDDTQQSPPPYVPPIRVLPSSMDGNRGDSTVSNTNKSSQGLRMLTVWNTLAADTGSGCPPMDRINDRDYHDRDINQPKVTYDCIEQEFDILDWYEAIVGRYTEPMLSYIDGSINDVELLPPTMSHNNPTIAIINSKEPKNRMADKYTTTNQWMWNTTADIEHIMSHPGWGHGMLYYHLFWQYDVLVVPAKNHTQKLKYGNVQRAVSQMRSGVPVLVEVWGPVMEDFVVKYNYTRCSFVQHRPTTGSSSLSDTDDDPQQNSHTPKFWSWEEAVEFMMDPLLRRECQERGLQIAQDYSPSTIGKKFLKAVGYEGNNFVC
jgi:hypothetical protein